MVDWIDARAQTIRVIGRKEIAQWKNPEIAIHRCSFIAMKSGAGSPPGQSCMYRNTLPQPRKRYVTSAFRTPSSSDGQGDPARPFAWKFLKNRDWLAMSQRMNPPRRGGTLRAIGPHA
ncbi:hypothetical protein LGM65_20370 [Burkholderia anthina]|uniref:hypothetical protein n=1 Tax=Burkholderia anthina TaxID=179879 RepID=UPI001CF130F8|nr:hypothetical protein [Burkholderia anthina]MCA8093214.1 hypothetical protein [Burkholderia anthina]